MSLVNRLRTAAAGLGLGLKKKICGCRFFTPDIHYNGGLHGYGEGVSVKDLEEVRSNKNIYLCFRETSFGGAVEYTSQVVRPIRLDLNTIDDEDDDTRDEHLLSEAAYKTWKGATYDGFCTTYNSDIIFPFGRTSDCATHILRIDPTITPISFPTQQKLKVCDVGGEEYMYADKFLLGRHESQTTLGCFAADKRHVVLGQVWNTLYCFSNDTRFRLSQDYCHNFEVFNQEAWVMWRSLSTPPFIRGKFSSHYSVTFLDKSFEMLAWETQKSGVFSYQIRSCEGWKQASPSLGDVLPFINFNGKRPFFITDDHPGFGERPFHLMFNYEPDRNPLLVSAYFMSHDFSSFQHLINKAIQLPEFCYDYLFVADKDEIECDLKHEVPNVCSDFEFVYLGKRKFGLVLHKYFEDHRDQGTNTGIILLVIFEYNITSTSEIQTEFLTTRRFRYHAKEMKHTLYYKDICCPYHKKLELLRRDGDEACGDDYTKTCQVHLNGAFLL